MYQLGHFLAEQKSILTSQQDMSLFGAEGKFEKLCKWKSKFKIANIISGLSGARAATMSVTPGHLAFIGNEMKIEPEKTS